MLIQEFFFPGHIKDIVLMLAEAGQNLPFRAGKRKPDTPGRIQEIPLPFREGDDLAVRRLADFRFAGFPQAAEKMTGEESGASSGRSRTRVIP